MITGTQFLQNIMRSIAQPWNSPSQPQACLWTTQYWRGLRIVAYTLMLATWVDSLPLPLIPKNRNRMLRLNI